MAKTKKQKTVKVWALTPEQADKWWELSDDEIETELGKESWDRVRERVLGGKWGKWETLDEFAKYCGTTLEAMREGVKQGNHFPRKPESFDKMCRSLGFSPSEVGRVLGGIYAEKERNEAINARGSALAKLLRMEDVYRRIKDPTDRAVVDATIDALWRQLNLLADREG